MGIAAAWFYIISEDEPSIRKAEDLVEKLWLEKDKSAPKISLFLARSALKNYQKKFDDSL